jgi:peptidoglycan hydrolase CwlO-like protein
MSAIAALIEHPLVRSIGQAMVYICAVALLTFIVLEFRTVRAERQAQQLVIDELARTVWADLEPRVEKAEKRPSVVRVPTWQNWQQQIQNRVQRHDERLQRLDDQTRQLREQVRRLQEQLKP